MRTVVIIGLVLLALPIAGRAYAAGASELDLLGKDPGKDPAYSCFSRHYDAAHLRSHPRQNVTNMSVFVESTYDAESDSKRDDYLKIGMNFRHLDKPFVVDGGCHMVDGKLSCGGDCGGGSTFEVTTKGKSSIYVSIPDGAPVYDPTNEDADTPKAASFGSDDKLFRLDRVDVTQCQSIMSDDAKKALLGTAEKSK